MNVTREVILDLLPLYVAGEASLDTRALVDEYLQRDSDLKQRIQGGGLATLAEEGKHAAAPRIEDELRSLQRTRSVLKWQRLTYTWACCFTLFALSGALFIQHGQAHFRFFLFDYPQVFWPCATLAMSCWVNYFFLRRRARASSL